MAKVLLSGMQPTGKLHLGNFEGALKNWVELQETGKYDMYCCIVDWHSLTVDAEDTSNLVDRIYDLAADYIASGLDPGRTTIFVQSAVKQHAELHLLLSMITPLGWLQRVPSYKEKSDTLNLDNYGFLGYPLLQAADILIYLADVVPVGKDQAPHIELTREIARRFNFLYGETFPEPKALFTKFAIVPGTDGRKMSKSYGNDICMGDEPDEIRKKISGMFTDPEKIYKGDPGHPDKCAVYMLQQIYNAEYKEICEPCKKGQSDWGCVKCKNLLADMIIDYFADFRNKRKELLSDKSGLDGILRRGADKARQKAEETMERVRKAMKLYLS
ncbi:tryptophan--tRNA ligase [bacterium]|nr:tryptophan--tRNA ligase [bacterium]